MASLVETLQAAGFKGDALKTAWAIVMRESGGRADAYNGDLSTGDQSHGLFQINMLDSMGDRRDAEFRKKIPGYTGREDLFDPVINAKAAYIVSGGGKNWSAWDIDGTGYLASATSASNKEWHRKHVAGFQEWLAKFPGENGQDREVGGPKGMSDEAPAGQDKLNLKELAQQNGFTMEFVKSHPQIRQVFETAINEDWVNSGPVGKAKFENALQATKWWKNNSSFAREYLMASMKGGKEWQDQITQAESEVQQIAVQMGASLTGEALSTVTKAYMVNGWKSRPQFLAKALAGELEDFNIDYIDYKKGGATNITDRLKATAKANGVVFDDSYYQGAARSVLAGLSTEDDYLAEIRSHAASMSPLYADRVRAGENLKDITSPYINTMSRVLELDPNTIQFDDPHIKSILGAVDEKGNPKAVGLWEFEKALRADDRWQYTKQANDQASTLASRLVSMFGFGG